MSGVGPVTPSRLLALALAGVCAAAALLVFWAAVPGPILERAGKIAALREDIVTLEKQRIRLGDLGRWTAARERALATRSEFLTKEGGSPAFAQIQLAMRSAANDAGVSVISAQSFSPADGAAGAAGVRMNVSADYNACVAFLAALSEATPRLVVSELTIRRQSGEGEETEYSLTVAAFALFWTENGA